MVVIGLKKRDTFEEVVEYIKHSKDVIKFPDRYAKQIRNSFELSQLDGVGMMEHEEHELQTMKETEKANALRNVARNNNDTSHVELLAHSQQSRPPVDTTSTIQQTDPVHHVIHSDSGYETGAESGKEQYKSEAISLRETAELEQRVLRTASENKINRLVESNSRVIGDLNLLWNTRHHQAQEASQRELQISSDSHQVMANYQNQIQDQRHQAESQQLAIEYQTLHRELERYRNRETELTVR